MKNRIIALLLVLASMTALTACADDKSAQTDTDDVVVSEEKRTNVVETDEETGESYYLLGDFENYYECSSIKYQGTFGKVTQIKKSEMPEMVTYGEQSAKLEILGTEQTRNQRNPVLRMATTTAYFNETTDFSKLSKFTFDIYNDLDYDVTIRFYVDTAVDSRSTVEDRYMTNDNYKYCITNKIQLEPKQWTHVEIPADQIKTVKYGEDDLKPYLAYGAEALEMVGAFNIMFDRGELHDVQQVYYIDNIRAYMSEK